MLNTNFYVWIEALKAYETGVKQLKLKPVEEVYFYGKDNAYYHLYLLGALKEKNIRNRHFIKNFLTTNSGIKISSSKPETMVLASETGFKPEVLRYFMAKNDTSNKDRTFTNELLVQAQKEYHSILNIEKRINGFVKINKRKLRETTSLFLDYVAINDAFFDADYGKVVTILKENYDSLAAKLSSFFEKKADFDLARIKKTYLVLAVYLKLIVGLRKI